jgi:hypothetical protein
VVRPLWSIFFVVHACRDSSAGFCFTPEPAVTFLLTGVPPLQPAVTFLLAGVSRPMLLCVCWEVPHPILLWDCLLGGAASYSAVDFIVTSS